MTKRKDPYLHLPDGPKPLFNPEFHDEDFIRLSKQGKNVKQIAAKWEVSRKVIYEWAKKYPQFGDTMKRGKDLLEVWYTELGQAAMIGQATFNGKPTKVDLGMYVWLTKNICKWRDKVDTKVKSDHKISTLSEIEQKESLKEKEARRKRIEDKKRKLELLE